MDPATSTDTMAELKIIGVSHLASPTWMLVTLDGESIVPSTLAAEATTAGLGVIT